MDTKGRLSTCGLPLLAQVAGPEVWETRMGPHSPICCSRDSLRKARMRDLESRDGVSGLHAPFLNPCALGRGTALHLM